VLGDDESLAPTSSSSESASLDSQPRWNAHSRSKSFDAEFKDILLSRDAAGGRQVSA
jgi:hypothetical protein